jgi:hypothetical protein
VFQVANNEIYEYGMVLFWSHFMTHFSQTGLIFNIETSKSFNGLVLVLVVFWVSFWSHIGLFGSHFGHQNGLIWSLLGLFWVSHKERPKQDQKERPKQDRRDRNKTKRRLI